MGVILFTITSFIERSICKTIAFKFNRVLETPFFRAREVFEIKKTINLIDYLT